MSAPTVGLISLVVLFLLLFSRMKIGLALALVGVLGFSYLVTPEAGLSLLGRRPFDTMASYGLTVVPLFMLMGQFTFYSGMGERIYMSAFKLVGRVPGGLAISTILGCSIFAAICGSGPATAATIGTISLPEMRKYKYDRKLASGSVAAGGTLGILIPPSVGLILYGIITEQSIAKLFIAGVLPGLLLSFLFVASVFFRVKFNPGLAPVFSYRISFSERIYSLLRLWDAFVLFLFVMGGLFLGIFTPTEAGAIGAFGSLAIAVARKKITLQSFVAALEDTARLTGMIFVIIIGAMIFGNFLAITKLPAIISAWGTKLPRLCTISWILVMCLLAGCILDAPSMIVLMAPLFFPVVVDLGYDPIWFGVIMVILAEAGLISPPVGLNAYTIASIAEDIPLETVFRGVLPFILIMIICIFILVIFPQIALFLPNYMM